MPKPLVVVRGAPLIEHHIRKLVAIGVQRIVINTSYLADTLKLALGDGTRFGCELIYSCLLYTSRCVYETGLEALRLRCEDPVEVAIDECRIARKRRDRSN